MTLPTPASVALVAVLALASWTDLRTGKIHNNLTGSGMLAGLAIHTIAGDPLFAIFGLGLAFAIHFPLWLGRFRSPPTPTRHQSRIAAPAGS